MFKRGEKAMVVDSFRSATVSVLRTYIGALPGDYRGPVGPELRPISTAGLPMPGRTKETDMMLNETEAV
jgi:hypothetical protein